MKIPAATSLSAFIVGMTMPCLVGGFEFLKAQGFISFTLDSPSVFPYFAGYFFITMILFVVGPRTDSETGQNSFKFYFPANKHDVQFMFDVWGRMFVWFLGVLLVGILFVVLKALRAEI